MFIKKSNGRIFGAVLSKAEQLNSVSTELDEWLENNEIPTGNDYTRTGCMIYCEPYTAERCVRDDILARSDTK